MFGSRFYILSILVLSVATTIGFRMFGQHRHHPNMSPPPAPQEPWTSHPRTSTPYFLINADLSIYCSKHVNFFGKHYIIPVRRHINCASNSRRGRNVRNVVCSELADLENNEEQRMGKSWLDKEDEEERWRYEWSTLSKLCHRITNQYVLLRTGFFKLDRINGTWEGARFDVRCHF